MLAALADANARDIVVPPDLPITKGLQESTHAFREVDKDLELSPLLAQVLMLSPLDLALAERTQAQLPDLVGGLSLALVRTFKILDPDLKNPHSRRPFVCVQPTQTSWAQRREDLTADPVA